MNFSFVYLVTAVYDAAVIREDAVEARKVLLQYDHVYDKLTEDDIMKDYILAFKHILFTMSAYLSRCAKKDDLYHEVPNFTNNLIIFFSFMWGQMGGSDVNYYFIKINRRNRLDKFTLGLFSGNNKN